MEGGQLLSNLFRDIDMFMVPGSSESLLISFCSEYLRKKGKIHHLTVSVNINDCAFHASRGNRQLADGDILTLDVSYFYRNNWIDMAWTYLIGTPDSQKQDLYRTARKTLSEALSAIWPGENVMTVAEAVSPVMRYSGCSIVSAGCGHGIGHSLHEEPCIPFASGSVDENQFFPLSGIITLEPVVTTGSGLVHIDSMTGEAITTDNNPAAYFETMVFLSPLGVEAPFWKNMNSRKWY
jgi:methionyl aminopeptidase